MACHWNNLYYGDGCSSILASSSREALYDLDNIQLASLSREDRENGLEAVYELDYLVIEGHARDVQTNSPPRGLQLQLGLLNDEAIDDTQVVLNLGYFQFKATPGAFRLDIRDGRGRISMS